MNPLRALAFVAALLTCVGARAADAPAYLFSYFIDNGQDGLRLAWSEDGLKWTALNRGESFLRPLVGESKLMRDPCITQGPDGTFHLVWTDSWHSRTIGYASSRDLINWSAQIAIPVMADQPTAKNCWAPEIIYDAKRERFMIFWATTLPEKFTETWFDGKNDNNHRIYFTTTKDFKSFTPSALFFEPGFNAIDSTILPAGGRFHMVVKDESAFPKARKNLLHAVADDLAGPYVVQSSPVTPSGGDWVEGPSLLQVGDYTYVYYDVYGRHRYEARRTRDWRVWETVPAGQLVMPPGIRHGTAFSVPRPVLDALLAREQTPAVTSSAPRPAELPQAANPILPGYFADPSFVRHDEADFIFATLDPWGGETLGCWESRDLANWIYRPLNWPTKRACTSPTSQGAMVWAPSVIQARDGRFFMYVSVGSEVWAGVANQPEGPWRNALGDRPLIPSDFKPGFHMIDAEAFIDDDGQAYLFWGSGWNWTNGRCWAVKLKPDMVTFDGEVRDVTPPNYFEAPFLFKHAGRYFLTYSRGRTDRDTYEVRYAVGDSPFGPFTEPANNPLLTTDKENDVISPGHHSILTREGRTYLLYHRHSVPFDPTFIGRQTCIDELVFGPDGLPEKVVPTHRGPDFLEGLRTRRGGLKNLADPASGASASASGQRTPQSGAERALDDNYATRWAAPADARGAWLKLDLGSVRDFTRQEVRFEYPWKKYRYSVEISSDGAQWQTLVTARDSSSPAGSPVFIPHPARARYLRLVFPDSVKGAEIAVIEWSVF